MSHPCQKLAPWLQVPVNPRITVPSPRGTWELLCPGGKSLFNSHESIICNGSPHDLPPDPSSFKMTTPCPLACRPWAAKHGGWPLPSHDTDTGSWADTEFSSITLGCGRQPKQVRHSMCGLWGQTKQGYKISVVSNTGKNLTKFSFLNKSGIFEASFEKLCLELFQFLVFWGGSVDLKKGIWSILLSIIEAKSSSVSLRNNI